MSDAPKKRPLFQIHLSTAIVLMFVAGGLLWANVRPIHDGRVIGLNSRLGNWVPSYVRGFPISVQKWYDDGDTNYKSEWSLPGIAANTAAALLILTAATAVSEYLIRRRERRRE